MEEGPAPEAPAPGAPQDPLTGAEVQATKPSDPSSINHVTQWIREPFKEDEFEKALDEHLAALAAKHGVDAYQVIYLLDAQDELSSWHSNRLYRAASSMPEKRPILLVLHNLGGSIEAGYLISKTCKGLSTGKFVVAVPRKAKSAATLLSLGADEIHMGLISELGPIDPQFGGLPALGMKNALEILSDLACKIQEQPRGGRGAAGGGAAGGGGGAASAARGL